VADVSRYRDASDRFMEILDDISPGSEPLGLTEAYLDVTGCEGPRGSPQVLRQQSFSHLPDLLIVWLSAPFSRLHSSRT
jgi:nucleotidyltransferase/DNA polymerase involved in DNA repair